MVSNVNRLASIHKVRRLPFGIINALTDKLNPRRIGEESAKLKN